MMLRWPWPFDILKPGGKPRVIIGPATVDQKPNLRCLVPWATALAATAGALYLSFDHNLAERLGAVAVHAAALAAMALAGGMAVLGVTLARTKPIRHEPRATDLTRQFARGMAHDINNLLTVLSIDVEMLADRDTEAADRTVLCASMLDACRQGAELATLLMAFAGQQTLTSQPVDLVAELSRRRGDLARHLAPGQSLAVDMPTQEVTIPIDADALAAALRHLVSNAGMASAADATIGLTVTVRAPNAADPAGVADIIVSDHGMGMSQDVLEKAMQPYFSAQFGGFHRGLGLPAVDGFARQIGGALLVTTRPGRGTSVTLRLPARRDSVAAPQRPQVRPIAAPLRQPARILVVDDNEAVRESLARRLRTKGHQVVTAPNIEQARRLLADGADVLVTDVVLGGAEDGVALAIEARSRDPALALVFISGVMSSRQPTLLAGDDMASFVRKPVNTTELNEVLDGLLAMRAMRRGG